jgi:peptide deformylase
MNPWLAKLKKFDDPVLSMVCEDLVPGEDLGFVRNLKFVCQATPNGIGLAAPQIGVLKRAVFVWPGRKGDGEFMLNPKITAASEEAVISRNEGCLSYPGFYADVRRRAGVAVVGQTLGGRRSRRSSRASRDRRAARNRPPERHLLRRRRLAGAAGAPDGGDVEALVN